MIAKEEKKNTSESMGLASRLSLPNVRSQTYLYSSTCVVEESKSPPFSPPQAERAAPVSFLYVDLAVCFEAIQTDSEDSSTDKVL